MAERALLLVRNAVTHDARVLRAAGVLKDEGYEVLVAGVATAAAPLGPVFVESVPVVRLAATPGVPWRAPAAASPGISPARAPSGSVAGAGSAPAASGLRGAARRTVRAAWFARGAIDVARRWRPVLVHANDHNTMWAALAIRAATGARVLYDSHELWADRNGRPEWRAGLMASEALFVRTADAVVTASPGYREALARRYRIAPPVVVRNIPRTSGAAGAEPASERPVAVYVGGLMPGRGLELAIDALAHAPAWRMRFVGAGAPGYVASLRDRATRAGVGERIELAGPVDPGELVATLAGAWAGIALIEPICRSYELTLPNKLFEYAAAGVPIVSSGVRVQADLVRGSGLGVVAALDSASVAGALRQLADPATQQRVRAALESFASANTWDRERELLAAAYRAARGRT